MIHVVQASLRATRMPVQSFFKVKLPKNQASGFRAIGLEAADIQCLRRGLEKLRHAATHHDLFRHSHADHGIPRRRSKRFGRAFLRGIRLQCSK